MFYRAIDFDAVFIAVIFTSNHKSMQRKLFYCIF